MSAPQHSLENMFKPQLAQEISAAAAKYIKMQTLEKVKPSLYINQNLCTAYMYILYLLIIYVYYIPSFILYNIRIPSQQR